MSTYASALSRHPEAVDALADVAGDVLDRLAGRRPDLVTLFASPHHVSRFGDLARGLRALLEPGTLVGATAAVVTGGGGVVEGGPALGVLAAVFDPDAGVAPVGLRARPTGHGVEIDGWPAGHPPLGTLVLVADPFSFPVDDFLAVVNRHAPSLAVVGGLASAARAPGGNRLALDGAVSRDGAVGVLLGEEIPVAAVVSQGARPIGPPLTVTRAERNVLFELAGRRALEVLLDAAGDHRLLERTSRCAGLGVGIAIDERRAEPAPDDYLVRSVVAVDREAGSVAVAAEVEVGRTVRFHVRDARGGDDDLHHLLVRNGHRDAALLFTCAGRGPGLFAEPGHDAATVDALAGPPALSGALCTGEVGPIGARNHLHGSAAALALFGP